MQDDPVRSRLRFSSYPSPIASLTFTFYRTVHCILMRYNRGHHMPLLTFKQTQKFPRPFIYSRMTSRTAKVREKNYPLERERSRIPRIVLQAPQKSAQGQIFHLRIFSQLC